MQTQRDAYLAHLAAAGHAESSLRTIAGRLDQVLAGLSSRGCLTANEVRPADLDALLLAWRQRGLARETLRGLRCAMRGFFGWLAVHGRILTDPACDLELGAVPEDVLPPAPLCEAEVATLIAAVPSRSVIDLRNRAHLELLYGCGLRMAESLALTLADLDLDRRTILVHGKGGSDRLLPLMAGAATALDDYLSLRRELLAGPDLGILFLGRRGKGMDAGAFRQWLYGHAKRTLGRGVNPHLLRHSIAVHLLRGGADIRHIQAFLGHADLDTTRIYLRLVPGHLREDYDRAMPELADGVVA